MSKETITVKTKVAARVQKVWEYWTDPNHISKWNFASTEWHCPNAKNDLKPKGEFSWRMEAKDGSMAFDYAGTYDEVYDFKLIKKHLSDGRKIEISFTEHDGTTEVVETFEPDENDPDLQRQGWQAILDNFKRYVESNITR